MKKQYFSPDMEVVKFHFERTLSDDDFNTMTHSGPQDLGEGEVEI